MVSSPEPNKQNVPLNNISKDKESGGSRVPGMGGVRCGGGGEGLDGARLCLMSYKFQMTSRLCFAFITILVNTKHLSSQLRALKRLLFLFNLRTCANISGSKETSQIDPKVL